MFNLTGEGRLVYIMFICIFFFFLFQNVEKGKTYSVILYVRSSGAINVSVSLTSSNGLQTLAAANIMWASLCNQEFIAKTIVFCVRIHRLIFITFAELLFHKFQTGQNSRFCWKQKERILVQDCNWQQTERGWYGLIKCQPCLWTRTRFYFPPQIHPCSS